MDLTILFNVSRATILDWIVAKDKKRPSLPSMDCSTSSSTQKTWRVDSIDVEWFIQSRKTNKPVLHPEEIYHLERDPDVIRKLIEYHKQQEAAFGPESERGKLCRERINWLVYHNITLGAKDVS